MRKCYYLKLLPVLSILIFSQFNSEGQTGGIPTGTDTACVNGIAFYQKTYGGNKNDIGFYLAPTTDSGHVIGGRTSSFGNGGNDGFLMKVDKRGNTIWSRAIGGSQDDYFQVVIRTSDNGFLGVGQTKSFGNAAGDAWLVKTDFLGNTQWAKKYGDGNPSGDIAFDAIEITEGGYIFCGTHGYAAGVAEGFVVRVDNSGNVIWSRQYGISGSDQLWGITEDGASVVVAGFYHSSTFYDGYIMKLDKANGNVQWMRGYDAEGRSNQFYRIRKTAFGFQMLGLVLDNFQSITNQQNVIWNFNNDGTLQRVTKMQIPSINNLDFGWYPRQDGGFLSINGDFTENSDLYISNVNPDGSLAWSKRYQRTGQQFVNNLMLSADGYFAAIGHNNISPVTLLDSNNIYLVRFDSLGNSGNCSGINTNDVVVLTPPITTPTPPIAPLGNVTINNPVITVGNQLFTSTTVINCFSCNIQWPIIPDPNCANGISFYEKRLAGPKADLAEWIETTLDSGYVFVGQSNSNSSGGFDGFITKVDKKGAITWSKLVGGGLDDILHRIKRTNDNGFIAAGKTNSFGNAAGDAWLIKMDNSGTIQWSRKYGDGNPNGTYAFEVIQLSDGGYAFCGVNQFAGGVSQSLVVRTDNLGNVIWSKRYDHAGSDEAWGIMEEGNSLLVIGFYRNPSFYDGYLMKLDKTNGAVQWKRTYDADVNRHSIMYKMKATSNGYQVFSLMMDDFNGTNLQQCVWNLATDGTVQNVRKIAIPGIQTNGYGWISMLDGGFVVVNAENNNSGDVIVTQVTQAGTIGWSKKYSRAGKQGIRAITTTLEGGYAAVGSTNTPGTPLDSTDIYLLRIDQTGSIGSCTGSTTTEATVISPSFTTSAITGPGPVDIVFNSTTIPTITSNAFSPLSNSFCFYCQPKPTGTAQPVNGGGTGGRHLEKVYPNPVIDGTMTLQIDALYNDRAQISIVDVNGTVLYTIATKELITGRNSFIVELPYSLRNYSNYVVAIQYKEYNSNVKIFVLR